MTSFGKLLCHRYTATCREDEDFDNLDTVLVVLADTLTTRLMDKGFSSDEACIAILQRLEELRLRILEAMVS